MGQPGAQSASPGSAAAVTEAAHMRHSQAGWLSLPSAAASYPAHHLQTTESGLGFRVYYIALGFFSGQVQMESLRQSHT